MQNQKLPHTFSKHSIKVWTTETNVQRTPEVSDVGRRQQLPLRVIICKLASKNQRPHRKLKRKGAGATAQQPVSLQWVFLKTQRCFVSVHSLSHRSYTAVGERIWMAGAPAPDSRAGFFFSLVPHTPSECGGRRWPLVWLSVRYSLSTTTTVGRGHSWLLLGGSGKPWKHLAACPNRSDEEMQHSKAACCYLPATLRMETMYLH